MRIGIISDSDSLIPLVYTLAAQKLQVYLYFAPSRDTFVNQKIAGFVKQCRIPLTEECNKDRDLYQWLNQHAFDVCFVIGYKHLIRLNKLNCRTALFNIHFGPLPAFKGPAPVFWQLKRGVQNLGLAIHRLNEKFDEGEIVWIKETPNLTHYNCKLATQLLSQLCVEGAFLIIRLIGDGMPVPALSRSHITPSYQKRPQLNDVLINWNEMNAMEICNLIRACNPWNKGAITTFKGQELKLMDAIVRENGQSSTDCDAGTVVNDQDGLFISCRDGKTINVCMIFFNDCYIPAYHCGYWGLAKGMRTGVQSLSDN
jgi:methionyl-tRNA formyltransferase